MSHSKDQSFEVDNRKDSKAAPSGFSSEVYGEAANDGGLLNTASARKLNSDLATATGDDGFELFDSEERVVGEETHRESEDNIEEETEGGTDTGGENQSSKDDENFEPGEDELPDNRKQIGTKPEEEPAAPEVSAESVTQGDIGNCFFLAGLASLANTPEGQQSIRDMVTTNDDGSATVTFPGDRSHPMTITQKDIEENIANGNIDQTSDTLMQVQTAFLKYDRIDQYGAGINELQRSGIPVFAQIRDESSALHLLTGEDTATKVSGVINSSYNLGGSNRENVAKFIQQALEDGQPVVAGTAPWADDPIVSSHAYSVLDYDPATDQVTVRNPWGHNEGHGIDNVGDCKNGITNIGDGKLTMSYETFFKNFDEIGAAGVNPTASRMDDIVNDVGNVAENNLSVGADILKGRFSEILPDVSNLLQSYSNLALDLPVTSVNQAESLLGARIRGAYNTVSSIAHGDFPSLSNLNNAALVPEPVLDGAEALVSKVGDIFSSIF